MYHTYRTVPVPVPVPVPFRTVKYQSTDRKKTEGCRHEKNYTKSDPQGADPNQNIMGLRTHAFITTTYLFLLGKELNGSGSAAFQI